MSRPTIDDNETLLRARLEATVDIQGIARTLEMLSEICADKAEHIRETWDEYGLAAAWSKVSNRIETVRESAVVERLRKEEGR